MLNFIINKELALQPFEQIFELQTKGISLQKKFIFLNQSVNFKCNNFISMNWTEYFFYPYILSSTVDMKSPTYYAYYFHEELNFRIDMENNPEIVDLHFGRKGLKWKVSESIFIIKDEKQNYIYLVNKEDKEIMFFASESDDSIKDPARIIREVLQTELIDDGYLPIHASAAKFKDECFLFVGNKGSGKTTLILEILNNYKGKFIANDKVLIKSEDDKLIVYGLPFSAYIGIGTMRKIPLLAPHIHSVYHVDTLMRPMEKLWGYGEKIQLMPSEICNIFGTEILASSVVNKIIFPRIGGKKETGINVNKVKANEFNDKFKDSIKYPDRVWPNWFEFGINDERVVFENMEPTLKHILNSNVYEALGGEDGQMLLSEIIKKSFS